MSKRSTPKKHLYDPIDDGLAKIVAELEILRDSIYKPKLIVEAPRKWDWPIHKFRSAILSAGSLELRLPSGRGNLSVLEFLRRWLQANGYGDDARELNDRVRSICKSMSEWSEDAKITADGRRRYVEDLERRKETTGGPEPADYFGEALGDRVGYILDDIDELFSFIETFQMMVSPTIEERRTKAKKKRRGRPEKVELDEKDKAVKSLVDQGVISLDERNEWKDIAFRYRRELDGMTPGALRKRIERMRDRIDRPSKRT